MKIFNRGDKQSDAKGKDAAAPAPVPEPVAAPPAPPAPDLTALIDANVKEMSEKIARLASTIENDHAGRGEFEAKLEVMEERMRKLSSLTEMISAQYNPFVGAAPAEREPLPLPEIGLAQPPAHPATAALAETLPPDAPPAAPEEPEMVAEVAPAPPETRHEAPAEDQAAARLWCAPSGFAPSLLLLNWADMLLKSAPSRDALVDVLDYYHNIGWIGDPARHQLLAYAEGLKWNAPADAQEWRGNVEMHEKSLLYVEKLRALAARRGE